MQDHQVAMASGGDPRSMSLEGRGRREMDQSELVGIKDGITLSHDDESRNIRSADLAGEQKSDNGRQVLLAIKCPSLSDHQVAESTLLTVSVQLSIAQLKRQIEHSWPGRPKAEGMRFFKAGQLLADELLIQSVVPVEETSEATPVHLVIRPGAWSEPISLPTHRKAEVSNARKGKHSSPTSAPDLSGAQALPAFLSTTSSAVPNLFSGESNAKSDDVEVGNASSLNSIQCDRHLASFIEQLDPAQYATFRSLLSWIYNRYIDEYQDAWMGSYGSLVENQIPPPLAQSSIATFAKLMNDLGLTEEDGKRHLDNLERGVLLWEPLESEGKPTSEEHSPFKYKSVTIDGLPYLLRIERNEGDERLKALLSRIDRLRNILHQVEKLINYQSFLDRTLPIPFTQIQGADAQQAAAMELQAGLRANSSFIRQHFALLQRSDIASVLMATSFLTFKMGILVYIFTRGASHTKIGLLAGVASLFVLFEGYKMVERKIAYRRRALERVLGQAQSTAATRHAVPREAGPVRPEDGATQAPQGSRRCPSPGEIPSEMDRGERHAIAPPLAPLRFRARSPLVLDYWIEQLAYLNLEEEDTEIGLIRPEGASRSVQINNRLVRTLNDYVLLPAVLFIATLVPEIERRRRRAIDKRNELIVITARKVEEQEERLAEAAAEKKEKDDSQISATPARMVQRRTRVFLQSSYVQRVLRSRSQGRQIDIAQELEAAAVANNEEDEAAMEQADMGFI